MIIDYIIGEFLIGAIACGLVMLIVIAAAVRDYFIRTRGRK